MRLLHLISTLEPSYGGPVAALSSLAEALNRLGVSVEVAAIDASGPAVVGAAQTHYLGPGMGKFGTGAYCYTRRLIPWLRQNLSRFDAVVCHGIWQYQSLACRAACVAAGVPYFVFVHGALDPWFKRYYPLKHLKKWAYWPWAEYRVLRDATGVLFTSDEERRLARQSFWLYRTNELVVNYGTIRPPPPSPELAQSFRRHFGIVDGERLFLFLSRIHEKKGCDQLIRAFATVAGDNPDLRLVLAGPDNTGIGSIYVRLCEELGIESRVTWTGMLQGDLKWGAFSAADVFVLPSHSENFGVAIVEAMGCGVPALVSDKVNIWQEIEEDRAGLVEPDTLEGTERLLRRWLGMSDSERLTMRESAKASFDKRYEISAVARQLIAVLQQGIQSRAG